MRSTTSTRSARVWVAGFLLLVALVCLPKLGNAFVWDDIGLIVESDRLFDLRNLPHVFVSNAMFVVDGGAAQKSAQLDTYRPVSISTCFLDAWLSGRNPIGYHIDNLIAHLACIVLVYLFALRLLGGERRVSALAAAAFFGVHPLLAEAHVWISGRSDVYSTLFVLAGASVWLDARTHGGLGRALASFSLFLLALLSKETAAPFLLVLPLWSEGFFQRPVRELSVSRRGLLQLVPIVSALLSYAALRVHALAGLHVAEGSAQAWLALQRLPLLVADALSSTLIPVRTMPRYLHEEYSRVPGFVLPICALIVFALLALTLRWRRRFPVLAFGLLNFVSVVAPVSLIATMAWYGFGRYLYLAIAVLAPGLIDVGARALEWLREHGLDRAARAGIAVYCLCIVLFALRLHASLSSWDGPVAFYASIISESPDASHGHGGLGKLLLERGQLDAGIRELQTAVMLAPTDARYLNNLAVGYLRSGQRDKARQLAQLGQMRFPTQKKFTRILEIADAVDARR